MTEIKEKREQLINVLCGVCGSCDADVIWPYPQRDQCEYLQEALKKLSALGLVFKVEGELPEITWINSYHQRGSTINGYATMDVSTRTENAHEYRTRIAQAGYTKTEPLEEK